MQMDLTDSRFIFPIAIYQELIGFVEADELFTSLIYVKLRANKKPNNSKLPLSKLDNYVEHRGS